MQEVITPPRVAVYAGSFDPPTHGHMNIITRASKAFDTLVVGVGSNSAKKSMFLPGDRKTMLQSICTDLPNVRVEIFNGLLVKFCQSIGAKFIIRGLRSESDFMTEFAIANVNRQQDPSIETLFLTAETGHTYVSSSVVKELAKYGGDINYYVHADVERIMKRKATGE
jgi:pantetheine-phosphate adenylyltransferase